MHGYRGGFLQELRTNELGLPSSQNPPKPAPLANSHAVNGRLTTQCGPLGRLRRLSGQGIWFGSSASPFASRYCFFGENNWLSGKTALFKQNNFPRTQQHEALGG